MNISYFLNKTNFSERDLEIYYLLYQIYYLLGQFYDLQ